MTCHLIDCPSDERERNAVRRVLRIPPLREELFSALGLPSAFCWCLAHVEKSTLGLKEEGEIDIIAGPLEWNHPDQINEFINRIQRNVPGIPGYLCEQLAVLDPQRSGGVKWPPSLDYVVCVEAKCAYLDETTRDLKSKKIGKSKMGAINGQLCDRLEMGFDRVGLLEIVANPPGSGQGSEAWMEAAGISAYSQDRMVASCSGRIPERLECGHWVTSLGAVEGGDETMRGTAGLVSIRGPPHNDRLNNDQLARNRRKLKEGLRKVLEGYGAPRSLPFLLEPDQSADRADQVEK